MGNLICGINKELPLTVITQMPVKTKGKVSETGTVIDDEKNRHKRKELAGQMERNETLNESGKGIINGDKKESSEHRKESSSQVELANTVKEDEKSIVIRANETIHEKKGFVSGQVIGKEKGGHDEHINTMYANEDIKLGHTEVVLDHVNLVTKDVVREKNAVRAYDDNQREQKKGLSGQVKHDETVSASENCIAENKRELKQGHQLKLDNNIRISENGMIRYDNSNTHEHNMELSDEVSLCQKVHESEEDVVIVDQKHTIKDGELPSGHEISDESLNDGEARGTSDGGRLRKDNIVLSHFVSNNRAVQDFTQESNTYKMDYPKRGRAVVFNNNVFSKELKAKGYSKRPGTNIDASRISEQLGLLGFEVERYQDLTVDAMFKVLKSLSEEDHSESDCFACVILSHGLKDMIFGYDGEVYLNDVFKLFYTNNCESLAGKPKLFFIQACRGDTFDEGVKLDVYDSQQVIEENPLYEQNEIRIPNEADFLIAYSTVSGFYSWRNSSNGSWFIQGLVRMLEEYGTILDIMRIMTRVNRFVAYNFESNATPDLPKFHQKKQMPCVTSMLRKDLFFIPKEAHIARNTNVY